MPTIATPARRRLVVMTLLLLAIVGGAVRQLAPEPSTLRDVGTLLLVLWLPTIGMLVGYLVGKIPRRPSQKPGFAPGAVFNPQLNVSVTALPQSGKPVTVDVRERGCMVLVEEQAFRARFARPLVEIFSQRGRSAVAMELLRPEAALAALPLHTTFYLIAGTVAFAQGRVEGRTDQA